MKVVQEQFISNIFNDRVELTRFDTESESACILIHQANTWGF